MDKELADKKLADKELVDRLAMDVLVHSSEEVAYSEAVVHSCEVVGVRPSSEAVDRSLEVLGHNYRILPRG